MFKHSLRSLLGFSLCVVASCSPVHSKPATDAPSMTTEPPATATAAALEGYYATVQAQTQTAIEARATALPFPTALPANVVQGWPANALGRRDGLTLKIRLPKDSYLAGEGGLADVEIRNDGPETVFINGSGTDLASLALLDQLGQQPDPWPFSFASHLMGGRAYLLKLEPGGVLSKTLHFQIPPSGQNSPSGDLHLWGETRFSRPEPDNPEGPDNIWLRLEAGPLKLGVSLPDRAHHLNVDWQVDRNQWQLSVKSASGQVPSGKVWGEIGIASSNTLSSGPLLGQQPEPGKWTGSWFESSAPPIPDNAQEIAGGWVAAEGYVTAAFMRTLPGEGDAGQMLGLSYSGPQREDFSTLNAAQAAVSFPIFALSPPLSGSALKNVRIERCCGKEPTQITVEQRVQMPGGGWIALTQMAPSADYASAGWGMARYDPEARQLDINGETAYAIERFGWRYLDWKVGQMGLELRTPLTLSLADLLDVAGRLGGTH